MNKILSQLSVEDIATLQKLGLKLWPVKITRDANGKKLAPQFPKNKFLTPTWEWIKTEPQPTPEQIHKALEVYDLAVVISDGWVCVDCDDSTAFQHIFNWSEAQGLDLYGEKSLSWTLENQKHHFYFRVKNAWSYCTKFSEVGFKGQGEILGAGHLVFLNKNGWYVPASEILNWSELPDLTITAKASNQIPLGFSEGLITNGSRNNRLTSIAGSLRRQGLPIETIYKSLLAANEQCVSPLDDRELQSIAKSTGRYDPAPPRHQSRTNTIDMQSLQEVLMKAGK